MKLDLKFSENEQLLDMKFKDVNVLHNGQNGATFTPSVSIDGIISWTNDKELENPTPINIKGDKGDKGDAGTAGQNGVSVTKTEINDKGELVITLSDNTVSNLGVVVGAKGDKGDQGEQGIQGIQGIPGEKGEKGDTGAPGADGVKGDKGDKGDTGATGAQGEPGKDGADGKDGTSATHSWNGTVLTITSASGTSSADLKGEKGDKGDTGAQGIQGIQGERGEKGENGEKGYTPVKGVDYFDGKDGRDGVSATHKWNGTVLTVTSASGTSSVDLKGETGADGRTPVKGTDYFTEADKEELVAELIANLPIYNGEVVTE